MRSVDRSVDRSDRIFRLRPCLRGCRWWSLATTWSGLRGSLGPWEKLARRYSLMVKARGGKVCEWFKDLIRFVRLVFRLIAKELYLTPCSYRPWLCDVNQVDYSIFLLNLDCDEESRIWKKERLSRAKMVNSSTSCMAMDIRFGVSRTCSFTSYPFVCRSLPLRLSKRYQPLIRPCQSCHHRYITWSFYLYTASLTPYSDSRYSAWSTSFCCLDGFQNGEIRWHMCRSC